MLIRRTIAWCLDYSPWTSPRRSSTTATGRDAFGNNHARLIGWAETVFFVTGASGNAGSAVVRALLSMNQPVRALVREAREGAIPPQAETVIGDLNQPDTFADALSGVRGAFLLSGYDGLETSLARMREVGVERVVLLSSSAAPSGDLSNAIARYHIESEQLVRRSGLSWTFLRPNSFMSNTLRWLPQLRADDTVRLPFADVAIAAIDPDDLAAVASLALTTPGHEDRSYRLSGPQSLRPADQVAVLAEILGRPLRLEPQSNDETRVELSRTMPAEYVDAFFRFFVDGTLDESHVLSTVEELTGKPPATFRQWATRHVDAFR